MMVKTVCVRYNLDVWMYSETCSDFVVEDDSLDLGDSTNGNWVLWDDLEGWDDPQQSPEFLENLAEDIQRRHRAHQDSASLVYEIHAIEDHPLARFPTDEDFIFSVQVKVSALKCPLRVQVSLLLHRLGTNATLWCQSYKKHWIHPPHTPFCLHSVGTQSRGKFSLRQRL